MTRPGVAQPLARCKQEKRASPWTLLFGELRNQDPSAVFAETHMSIHMDVRGAQLNA